MSSTIIQRRSIPLIPLLAREIGTNEALVLQQIGYWLERSTVSNGGKKWVYNTTKEWVQKEFCFMSESTLKRTLSNLRKLGLIESKKLAKKKFYHINYYTINYDELAKIDAKISLIEQQEIDNLSVDDLNDINHDDLKNHSNGSIWSVQDGVKVNQPRTGQCDTVISESPHRVHSESSLNTGTEKEKPATKTKVKFTPVKPDGVSEQTWSDLLALRKAKRAVESQTAWNSIFNALEKTQQATGHSLEQMIVEWVTADWKGFRFDWYMNRTKAANQLTVNNQGYNHGQPQQRRLSPAEEFAAKLEQQLAAEEGGHNERTVN